MVWEVGPLYPLMCVMLLCKDLYSMGSQTTIVFCDLPFELWEQVFFCDTWYT